MWFLLAGDWYTGNHAWPSRAVWLQVRPVGKSSLSSAQTSANWEVWAETSWEFSFFSLLLSRWWSNILSTMGWYKRCCVIQRWLPPQDLRCPLLQHLRRRSIISRVCFVFWLWWRQRCSEVWWIPHSWWFSSSLSPATRKQGQRGVICSCQQLCPRTQQLLRVPNKPNTLAWPDPYNLTLPTSSAASSVSPCQVTHIEWTSFHPPARLCVVSFISCLIFFFLQFLHSSQ